MTRDRRAPSRSGRRHHTAAHRPHGGFEGRPRRGLALVASLALAYATAACSDSVAGSGAALSGEAAAQATVPSGDRAAQRPLIETVPPPTPDRAWLDADADPRTAQGETRARHLPRWTPDLDAAFPPAVCGSAWELDAIAVPVSDVDIGVYGEPATMAALAVMRYEHLVSSARAAPGPLAQLCIAVAAVDPARRAALAEFAPLIDSALEDTDGASAFPGTTAAFPDTVTVVALSPSSALAAACIASGDADVLRAYELVTARGIEDGAVDVSYRVARTSERPGSGCAGAPAWAAEWAQRVQDWIAEGQVWLPVYTEVTVADLCAAATGPDADDCPQTWEGMT